MASSSETGAGEVPHSNRNLWIILASVLGTLVVAFVIGILWTCRRHWRVSLFPTRTVTPLDDAEFESWRRPSQYMGRRYTVMPRKPSPVRMAPDSYNMFEKEVFLAKRPSTPPPRPPRPSMSLKSQQTPPSRHSRTNSIQDRPPTPYSSRVRSIESIPASPTSITRPKKAHSHFPSVSDASESEYEFEKFQFDIEPLNGSMNRERNPGRL